MSRPKKRPLWFIVDVSNWAYKDLFAAGPGAASLKLTTDRLRLCASFFKPERFVLCFDTPSFRHNVDPMYKANRRERPVGLDSLIASIRKYALDESIDCVKVDGFEADDCIASITQIGVDIGRDVVIASHDKDLCQLLIDGRVCLLYSIKPPKRGGNRKEPPETAYYSTRDLSVECDLHPSQWIDYQCLVGDASDNIPGCDGFGDKRAKELLASAGSLEEYFANVWNANITAKQRAALAGFRKHDLGRIRRLVTLRRDVPLPAAWREESVA